MTDSVTVVSRLLRAFACFYILLVGVIARLHGCGRECRLECANSLASDPEVLVL